jgi:hypothetical protein
MRFDHNGVAVDSAIGTGASPLVFANETQVGIYTVTGFKLYRLWTEYACICQCRP